MRADLIVVVPVDQMKAMLEAGFKSGGRANSYTSTLMKTYPDPDQAMSMGRRMPYAKGFIWSVEPSGRNH